VGTTSVYLSALRLETGELLIVASNVACAKLVRVFKFLCHAHLDFYNAV
jgi:hypothetical protein